LKISFISTYHAFAKPMLLKEISILIKKEI